MPSVHIVGGHFDIESMFRSYDWGISGTIPGADLVCFTGGEDVTPALYGAPNRGSGYNINRDAAEIYALQIALDSGKPCVGICRGGQFLNVMSGGKMIQDISGHAKHGTHTVYTTLYKSHESLQVTSTHHQMMWPSKDGEMFMFARGLANVLSGEELAVANDVEGVYYAHTRALCFQPHPEFSGDIGDTRVIFFDAIKKYFALEA